MQYTFRALETWPDEPTEHRRGRYTFKAPWSSTMRLLETELHMIGGVQCVIAAGFREQDIRLDGMPRGGAREPSHPGIEISFTATGIEGSPRLVYRTDVCEWWQHNVRIVALGLESLRAVDRYGITRRSEQYAGWKQLGTGSDPAIDLLARGRALIRKHGTVRAALAATHPDAGGDPDDFLAVTAARA